MDNKKRVVFISVLTILLVITGLYATYAINVFEEETTPTEYDMAFNFDLSGNVTRQMTVPAGKTKVFDIDITNPYTDTVQYGVAYSLVSPTTLPSGVTIAQTNISKNDAVGQISASSTISTSIVVVNESSSSVTISFSVINGYKNGGDLIVPTGKTLVEGSYEVVPPPSLVTLTNLGLTSLLKEGTPDFSNMAPIDTGVILYSEVETEFSNTKLEDVDSRCWVIYSDSYTFDDNTGNFSLNSASTSEYMDIYSQLNNKYITQLSCYEYSSAPSISKATNLTTIYYVTSASAQINDESGIISGKKITSSSSSMDYSQDGIYAAEDDLGTTYYFRGASTKNYVKFGKNTSGNDMYWRIIRINGDGTIRMIYDGTSAHANGTSSADRYVARTQFNTAEDDNTYVGYMIGTAGASDYETTHSNSVDSVVKNYIDNDWYANNILGTNYEQYIADAIYCNDREVDSTGKNAFYETGDGSGANATWYKPGVRIFDNKTPSIPTLKCSQKNDRFTLQGSTIETTDGLGTNEKLKYPVGLITADELVTAGAHQDYCNEYFYLYNGSYGYWTMSPVHYSGYTAFTVTFEIGAIYIDGNYVASSMGVRPVISLKADALKYDASTSNGTMEHPFVLAS